ncbi:hypothetical protein ACHAXS_000302 [Conticribra weissflogii]
MEIIESVHGLSQAGILANQLLKSRLANYGFSKVLLTSSLWKHHSKPIQLMIVVDFGIKYINKKDAVHLLNALKDHYKMNFDWTGRLYCEITL